MIRSSDTGTSENGDEPATWIMSAHSIFGSSDLHGIHFEATRGGSNSGLWRRLELTTHAARSARNVLQRLSERPGPHQSNCQDNQHHRAGDEDEHAGHAEILQHECNDERTEYC